MSTYCEQNESEDLLDTLSSLHREKLVTLYLRCVLYAKRPLALYRPFELRKVAKVMDIRLPVYTCASDGISRLTIYNPESMESVCGVSHIAASDICVTDFCALKKSDKVKYSSKHDGKLSNTICTTELDTIREF